MLLVGDCPISHVIPLKATRLAQAPGPTGNRSRVPILWLTVGHGSF